MSTAVQGLQQSQRQTQKIALTPQLRQSLRILQLPATELRQEINNELAINPLLEELPPADTDLPLPPPPATATAAPPAHADATGDSTDPDADPSNAPLRPPKHDTPAPDDDYNETLQKERDDWGGEFHDTAADAATAPALNAADAAAQEEYRQHLFDTAPQAAPSLETHLLAQARELAPDPRIHATLETLIGELDERGFLATDLATLSLRTDHTRADLDTAWRLLKTFDPPGIAAADLRECLLLQLYRQHPAASTRAAAAAPRRLAAPRIGRRAPPPATPAALAIAILEHSYPLLLKRRIPELATAHRVTSDAVHAAFALLAKLQTNPARAFDRDENRILVPDITIRRGDAPGDWDITLNNALLPRLRLNPDYKSRLGDKTLRPADREYITGKIREGRFFLGAIEQRQQTLARLARLILHHQADYFEHGPAKLRPLTMAQLARELDVHETTVSRAIANKSVATPHGVRELRYFFTAGLTTTAGENLASSSVRDILQQIIADAPPDAPLSDERLSGELRKRGIHLARRTIAKYRATLNILPAHLRRTVA